MTVPEKNKIARDGTGMGKGWTFLGGGEKCLSARKGTCWERGDVSGIQAMRAGWRCKKMRSTPSRSTERESERARIWARGEGERLC